MGQKLGQHFLRDEKLLQEITNAADLENNDVVLEIGPGHGELTQEILKTEKGLRILALEKDIELTKSLEKKFALYKNFEIIKGDALKTLPNAIRSLKHKKYKIIGNIPYYITGRLLRIISELEILPEISVFTIQKEVALRLTAKPPEMNLLAGSIQFWAKPEIISFIPKKFFFPQPKVDSAVIKLKIIEQKPKFREFYYQTLKMIFKQPRKTILNNINDYFKNQKNDSEIQKKQIFQKISELNINLGARPQNLDVETIKKLSQVLYNK